MSRSLCRACRGGWGVHTHVVSRDVSVLVARPRHVAAQVFATHLPAGGGLDRGAAVEGDFLTTEPLRDAHLRDADGVPEGRL